MTNFRDAKGKLLNWYDTRIEADFSNFVFVDQNFYSNAVLRRIFSLARKLNFQSLLVEEISETDCSLLCEENEALSIRHSEYASSSVNRILFLKCLKDAKKVVQKDDLLGYAIFKVDNLNGGKNPIVHVFEAVLKPSRDEAGNNFIHTSRLYEVNTQLGWLSVRGVLFAQQNDSTFVCAHVALRTALSSIVPDKDVSYGRINEILGIDHQSRLLGEGVGLSPDEMKKVLEKFKVPFTYLVHEPNEKPPINYPGDFQRDLYGIIESGQPALLGFELADNKSRHIIPVIGHTFNEDTWVAEASRAYFKGGLKYFPSENWLSTYLIHDDNFGPYLCLPRHFLKKDNFRIIIGLCRNNPSLTAVEIEAVGILYLNSLGNYFAGSATGWLARFTAFARAGLLVLRTLLITKEEYLDHIRAAKCWDGSVSNEASVKLLKKNLPSEFWLVEASAPELFSASRRKFGEVLISSNSPAPDPIDDSLLIAARLPGVVFTRKGSGWENTKNGTNSHIELFHLSESE